MLDSGMVCCTSCIEYRVPCTRQCADDQARIQAQQNADSEALTTVNSSTANSDVGHAKATEASAPASAQGLGQGQAPGGGGGELDSRPPLLVTTPLYEPSMLQHLLRSFVYGSTFTAAFFV